MKFQLEQLCKFVGQVTDPKTAANVDLNDIRLVKKSLGEIDIRWKSPGPEIWDSPAQFMAVLTLLK
jgi:hypothetical protein